jgi:hypothetical protein
MSNSPSPPSSERRSPTGSVSRWGPGRPRCRPAAGRQTPTGRRSRRLRVRACDCRVAATGANLSAGRDGMQPQPRPDPREPDSAVLHRDLPDGAPRGASRKPASLVRRDRHEPGTEAIAGLQAVQAAPGARPRGGHSLLRERQVTGHQKRDPAHLRGVRLDDPTECGLVPGNRLAHRGVDVGLARGRRGHGHRRHVRPAVDGSCAMAYRPSRPPE